MKKRIFAAILILVMMLGTCSEAYASDLGTVNQADSITLEDLHVEWAAPSQMDSVTLEEVPFEWNTSSTVSGSAASGDKNALLPANLQPQADGKYHYALVIHTGIAGLKQKDKSKRQAYHFEVRYNTVQGSQTLTHTVNVDLASANNAYNQTIITAAQSPYSNSVISRANIAKQYTDYKFSFTTNPTADAVNYMGSSMGVDTLFFTTAERISSIKEVDVFFQTGIEWTISDLEVYTVGQDCRLEMAGYISNTVLVQFAGCKFAYANISQRGTTGEVKTTDPSYGFYRFDDFTNMPADQLTPELMEDPDLGEYYYVNIELADTYDAGINSLFDITKVGSGSSKIANTLTAEFFYNDTQKNTLTVNVPVMANAFYLLHQKSKALSNPINLSDFSHSAYAQGGTNILMYVYLPHCAGISKVELSYDNPDSADDGGIRVAGIQFYNAGILTTGSTNPGSSDLSFIDSDFVNDYNLNLSVKRGLTPADAGYVDSRDPLMYYYQFTGKDLGRLVNNGAQRAAEFPISNYTDEILDNNYIDTTDLYLITLVTDEGGGGEGDPSFTVNYENDNESKRKKTVKISQELEQYYGFWKDNSGNDALHYGMQSEHTLCFFMEISGLAKLNSVAVTMPKTEKDLDSEWQIKTISIKKVSSYDNRRLIRTMGKITEYSCTVFRNVIGTEIYKSDVYLMLQNGQTKEVDATGTITVEREVRDMTSRYTIMTFEQAREFINWLEAANTYTVDVEVASNFEYATREDTCGSMNLFYFQLIFERGKSSYVLANSHLKSDGFTAGTTASFTIKCNEEYGDVTAINILPSDSQIDANSDVLDKLCIKEIAVNRPSPNGTTIKYTIPDIGWINPAYTETVDASVAVNRTAAQLVHTYLVTHKSYCARLEFAITTGEYPATQSSSSDLPNYFYGAINAELGYRNGAKEKTCVPSIDVVDKIYSYQNHTAKVATADGTNKGANLAGKTVSDTSTMFRANHTDRFYVDVEDISSLEYLTLDCTTYDETIWNIKSIAVGLVNGTGSLRKNAQGDYQMQYNAPMTTVIADTPLTNRIHASYHDRTTITFGENYFETNADNPEVISVQPCIPNSNNDTLNVYVFLDEGASSPATYGDMYASVTYCNDTLGSKNKKTKQALTQAREKSGGQYLLYATGIDAAGFTTFTNFGLDFESNGTGMTSRTSFKVDRVIIQHYRSSVLVETFRFGINGDPAKKSYTTGPLLSVYSATDEMQEVIITLGENTQTTFIKPDIADMQFAFYYKSQINPDNPMNYRTPLINMSDEGVTKLEAGDEIRFTLDQSYVGRVSGIDIRAINGIQVDIESVIINTYVKDENDEYILRQSFGYDELGVVHGVMNKTEENMMSDASTLVSVAIKNSADAGTFISSETVSGKVIINYIDNNNKKRTKNINVRKSMDKKSVLGNGTTVNVQASILNLQEIKSIQFAVTSSISNETATWNVDNVTVSYDSRNGTPVNLCTKYGDQLLGSEYRYVRKLEDGAQAPVIPLQQYEPEKDYSYIENTSLQILTDSPVSEFSEYGDVAHYATVYYTDYDGFVRTQKLSLDGGTAAFKSFGTSTMVYADMKFMAKSIDSIDLSCELRDPEKFMVEVVKYMDPDGNPVELSDILSGSEDGEEPDEDVLEKLTRYTVKELGPETPKGWYVEGLAISYSGQGTEGVLNAVHDNITDLYIGEQLRLVKCGEANTYKLSMGVEFPEVIQ